MIVKPRIKGFVCITSHPKGCYENVKRQVDYTLANSKSSSRLPKRVLVIGSSTGYGLSSRITAAFSGKADTLGVFFERPPKEDKPASAGFYNNYAFESIAAELGTSVHKSVNGDAFSDSCKQEVVELAKSMGGKFDLIIYSLASPRRIDPSDAQIHKACLKPIGAIYKNKTLDTDRAELKDITIEPASSSEIDSTIKVMGGEDWALWTDLLLQENLLAKDCLNIAYSYIGPEVTQPIYRNGTIGRAKEHLEHTASALNTKMIQQCGGQAFVSVNKAVVTQASSAIPVVPLYVSLLFKVMRELNNHEGCIEQIVRMFNERLYGEDEKIPVDESGRIRLDDWEMSNEVQCEIINQWSKITSENLNSMTNFEEYQNEFLKLFGFGFDNVNYEEDVDLVSPF